jgi:hypothetical protein
MPYAIFDVLLVAAGAADAEVTLAARRRIVPSTSVPSGDLRATAPADAATRGVTGCAAGAADATAAATATAAARDDEAVSQRL